MKTAWVPDYPASRRLQQADPLPGTHAPWPLRLDLCYDLLLEKE
jgi:hypothetical protein